jgi:hypothetical protein
MRSPTLLGVAPPPRAPSGLADTELGDFNLDDMRPSKPPLYGAPGPAPQTREESQRDFDALLGAGSRDGTRMPQLETPSAFDFMADRNDDNVATVRRSVDFDASPADANLTQRLGSVAPNPAYPSWPIPSGSIPPSALPSEAPYVPSELPAPIGPLESEVPVARRMRLRRIVGGVLAATAALLVIAVVVALVRRKDSEPTGNLEQASAATSVETAPETAANLGQTPPSSAAPAKQPPPTTAAQEAQAITPGRSATPAPPKPPAPAVSATTPHAQASLSQKSTTSAHKTTPKLAPTPKKAAPKKATTKKAVTSKKSTTSKKVKPTKKAPVKKTTTKKTK